jgi:amino acid adenylation domain-containing protein
MEMQMKNVEDFYPLSHIQQGILFHSLNAPNSGVYHEQRSFTLRGDLDISAFKHSWQRVVDRHPILRTAFIWEGLKEPIQVVHRQVSLPWEQQNWHGLSQIERAEQLAAFLEVDRKRGFEFSKAPLMRMALFQITDDTYQFVWSYNHVLIDGWSMALIFKEVFNFYEAFRNGQDMLLEQSPHYKDYVKWLKLQDLSKAEMYWREALKGFVTPTSLGANKLPSKLSDDPKDYDYQHIQLSHITTAALQAFARQHHLTLNTVVLGAWAILLSRYSGEDDIVLGATVSGRPATLDRVEGIIGICINTLPVRVRISSEASLLSWLKELQIQQVQLREYEYSPLVEIQRWSEVPRDQALFESILVFENFPVGGMQELSKSLDIGDVRFLGQTNYPLAITAIPGQQFVLTIEYYSNRYPPDIISRMLGHLQILLEGIVANPEGYVSELPILTDSERYQLLVDWNSTQSNYRESLCLHELFELQAELNPDRTAVVFKEEQLSYEELNQRANQLARHLRNLGVGPEVLVGICVERSMEMLIGVLGVLKAGGAYVPLDPAYPNERLAFMLKDSQVAVLLSQKDLLASLPAHGAQLVILDEWNEIAKQSSHNLTVDVVPNNLAYVIYTSGSTGKPKGVMICHKAVVNFMESMAKKPRLRFDDILLAVTTLSFDISILELFLPLSVGASVVIATREIITDGILLKKLLSDSGATVMQATPATWRMLLEVGWQDSQHLKMLCGGEALSHELADQLLKRGRSLWNMYGPTETTIWSAVCEVTSGGERVNIGPPIANTEFYVLDKTGNPVPVGVPGELYIGGVGLARGYLNRPELTAEKFVPHHFSSRQGDCLYRTGDLVRYHNNSEIEFIGRIDHQIKIRGYRIEMGEIEAILDQHADIRASIVIVREDRPGDKRLVAYLLSDSKALPTNGDLRKYLQERLPDYMVPSFFIELDEFPLTPSGKIDRKRLPEPDGMRAIDDDFVAPSSPMETTIAAIWQKILGVDQISTSDNFFDLGGHSILSMRVINEIEKSTGKRLNPRDMVFQTLEGIATLCETEIKLA